MKILVFSPTTQRMSPQLSMQIMNQRGEMYFDLMMTRDNPYQLVGGEVLQNVQLNYEKMRQVVLTQGYSKVWIVEDDMIIPDDALLKLLEVDAQIVSGLYSLRHGEPAPNLFRYEEKVKSLGNNMSWSEVSASWGKTIRISGGAMGCLLVDRSALDFNFEVKDYKGAPDIPFMVHSAKKDVVQKARLDVVCGHIKANGDVLYPDKVTGYRIERHEA